MTRDEYGRPIRVVTTEELIVLTLAAPYIYIEKEDNHPHVISQPADTIPPYILYYTLRNECFRLIGVGYDCAWERIIVENA